MVKKVAVDDLSAWAKQHVGDDEGAVCEFLSRLYLGPPLLDGFLGYRCTPLNVDVFSYTDLDGGNNEHLIVEEVLPNATVFTYRIETAYYALYF